MRVGVGGGEVAGDAVDAGLDNLGAAGVVEVDDGLAVLLKRERGEVGADGGRVEGGVGGAGGDGGGGIGHGSLPFLCRSDNGAWRPASVCIMPCREWADSLECRFT